jgi:hypothetical protein
MSRFNLDSGKYQKANFGERMNKHMKLRSKNRLIGNSLMGIAAFALASCATLNKPGSDVSFENLRAFEIAFVDQYAVPGKPFDAAAFDAKVAEGNAKFQDAMTNEKFKARRPVLKDLADQFKAEAAHLRKKASSGKVTKALAAEMKRDINDNYDHAIAKKTE